MNIEIFKAIGGFGGLTKPNIYLVDENGNFILDENGNKIIAN